MCLNFTDFDRSTGQNEPYQSKIFSENNTFPLLDTVYIDDFAKFRTRKASTCGCYCSFENYNANFSRKLPSTHLLGFSKTSTEYWTAVGHIMDENYENYEKGMLCMYVVVFMTLFLGC